MVLLSLESENGAVLSYRLDKNQITVGSSSKNDVVVRSPGVADKLLVIYRAGDKFTFVTADRQSVVLNGERRARGVLNPGDKLRLGGMSLVFRGFDNSLPGAADEPATAAEAQIASGAGRGEDERFTFRADPAGFGVVRSRLVEMLADPSACSLKQVVSVVAEAMPGVEIALLGPSTVGEPVPLASVWSGPLPRIDERLLGELKTLGRFAQMSNGEGAIVVFPILAGGREVTAFMVARPLGVLGEQGTGLVAELTRMLSTVWQNIGRPEQVQADWEEEARQRVEAVLPGTSQAMQVLRAGLLAAAYGGDPVLVCGARGVGRTEVARILATLGPVAGRPVVVLDGAVGDVEALRRELFGPSGHPSFGPSGTGAAARARDGLLIIRNIDNTPAALQEEIGSYIAAQQREPLALSRFRWVVTCGENPLALVQQGKVAASLFLLFSHRMLRVPRLAERREDLPLLIAVLLRRAAAEQGKRPRGITLECLNVLLAQPYSGEMAELVGTINRLVTASPDAEMIRCEALTSIGEVMPASAEVPGDVTEMLAANNLKELIPHVEQFVIDRVMRKVRGNQSEGSRILGISRGALIAKLKEYAISDYRFLRRHPRG